ncbi:MAG TPA: aryl-sulfate sulfotransferase [Candidatus Udaeobacter sp.]|nr:aryl-sulfate sulfotransferase [Candidatus Udaeobacter sp.]
MSARLITPVAVLLSLLSVTVGPGQTVGNVDRNVEVFEGPTPFIRFVNTTVSNIAGFHFAQFLIFPKTGSATRRINVRYARSYLEARGYFNPQNGNLTIPVFGLYAGRSNRVLINLGFSGRAHRFKRISLIITTPPYDGGTYTNPTVIQPRLAGTTLSYDFILLKGYAQNNTPIIIDSDAEVRWVGTAGVGAQNCILFDNAFYLTSGSSLLRTEFDGVTTPVADYSGIGVTGFHHNIDPGREGMILDVDTVDQTESVNLEVDAAGNVLRTWRLADIISAAMIAGGDDPSLFVYPAPNDWFHNNACAYRSSDNSLIVSSRENFVLALDYDSGNIKWILGDPTKHWYEFQSLRQFSLTLDRGTLPPIGQHGVSMPGDQLLLFDDGAGSNFQQPPGETRNYSAPRKYQIDLGAFEATEIWHYYPNPSVYSPFCSSVYEDAPNNYLIDYTLAGPYVYTGIVGLDALGNVAFNYQYDELAFCGTAWNAIQIHWENVNLE